MFGWFLSKIVAHLERATYFCIEINRIGFENRYRCRINKLKNNLEADSIKNMNKNKKQKPLSSAIVAGKKGESNPNRSPEQKGSGKVKRSILTFMSVVLMSFTGLNENEKAPKKNAKTSTKIVKKSKRNGKVSTQQEKPVKLVKLTDKQKEVLKAKTLKARLALATLPPSPYSRFSAAPKLSKMNPAQLCTYVSDKFPRIMAIAEFGACVPTVVFVEAIYNALLPLASKNRKDITSTERVSLALYDAQLRENFTNMIVSCVSLANGDRSLFSLTAVATRKSPEKHDGKPTTPVFRITYKKGRGTLGIMINKIPYVKNYVVWYGKGVFDKATWNWQQGSTRQLIINLNPGDLTNVFVIAKGTKQNSDPSNVQGGNVPFN